MSSKIRYRTQAAFLLEMHFLFYLFIFPCNDKVFVLSFNILIDLAPIVFCKSSHVLRVMIFLF